MENARCNKEETNMKLMIIQNRYYEVAILKSQEGLPAIM